MNITKDIKYVGVNDKKIDLFEGLFTVPEGMAYNSFLILDDKIAVTDSVDRSFGEEWLNNIDKELQGKAPDYLIVHHMEPDHSSNIFKFMDKYKDAKIVASKPAFNIMNNYFGTSFADRQIVVTDGSTLDLGKHKFSFVTAPMVHWPEVIMSYDATDKVLFSADAFGKFGANEELFVDPKATEDKEIWDCEARRYYFGIVGKFGEPVQKVLAKLGGIEVETICSLHGPVLNGDLSHYINIYNTWSSYQPEDEGVTIAYTSVYGHTKDAVTMLKEELESAGKTVSLFDLARDDMAEAVEDAFRYSKLVLATTTYNTDIFPFMKHFIFKLTERNYQNRKVGFIENGSWGPVAAKKMKEYLGDSQLEYAETVVSIKGSVNDTNKEQMKALAKEMM